MQHVQDVLKVIEFGRKKFGPDWYGSGGYAKADSFSKHFANQCRECNNYNKVRAMMKDIMEPLSCLERRENTLYEIGAYSTMQNLYGGTTYNPRNDG